MSISSNNHEPQFGIIGRIRSTSRAVTRTPSTRRTFTSSLSKPDRYEPRNNTEPNPAAAAPLPKIKQERKAKTQDPAVKANFPITVEDALAQSWSTSV